MYETYRLLIMDIKITEEVNKRINEEILQMLKVYNLNLGKQEPAFVKKLKRVLVAVSFFEDIGYCQNWSYVAASLLLHGEEEFVYHVFTSLLRSLEARRLYERPDKGFQQLVEHFFFEFEYPGCVEIRQQLSKKGIFPGATFKAFYQSLGFSWIPLQFHLKLVSGVWATRWEFLHKLLGNILFQIRGPIPRVGVHEFVSILRNPASLQLRQAHNYDFEWSFLFI